MRIPFAKKLTASTSVTDAFVRVSRLEEGIVRVPSTVLSG